MAGLPCLWSPEAALADSLSGSLRPLVWNYDLQPESIGPVYLGQPFRITVLFPSLVGGFHRYLWWFHTSDNVFEQWRFIWYLWIGCFIKMIAIVLCRHLWGFSCCRGLDGFNAKLGALCQFFELVFFKHTRINTLDSLMENRLMWLEHCHFFIQWKLGSQKRYKCLLLVKMKDQITVQQITNLTSNLMEICQFSFINTVRIWIMNLWIRETSE